MLGLLPHVGQRNLVRTPRAFDRQAVDDLRTGPTLRGAHDDHRPTRAVRSVSAGAGPDLDGADLGEHVIESGGQLLVHERGVVAGDEDTAPSRSRSTAR